jgi:hypothetical protein
MLVAVKSPVLSPMTITGISRLLPLTLAFVVPDFQPVRAVTVSAVAEPVLSPLAIDEESRRNNDAIITKR